MPEALDLFGQYPAVGTYLDPRTRQPITLTNPAKAAQKNFWLDDQQQVTIGAGAAATTTMVPPRDQGDQGDSAGHALYATSTGQFAISMYSDVLDRRFMNNPVESSLVFGTGNWPAMLLERIYVPATSAINCDLTDLSANPNTVRLCLHSLQVLNPIANLGRSRSQLIAANTGANTHPYWLTFDEGSQVTVLANATSVFTMTVPSDADFNCWGLRVRSDQGADSFSIAIEEGQRRSQMRTGVVPIQLVGAQTYAQAAAPDGIIPAAGMPNAYWPDTHLYQRNTIIQIRITDTSGNDNLISAALAGQLIYYPHAPAGLQEI